MIEKPDIKDISGPRLMAWLNSVGAAPYRYGQIMRWICQRQLDDFEAMTDLSQDLRRRLADHFVIRRLKAVGGTTSRDGSQKYLYELNDGQRIESVLIPERGHYTLCISTQVGCAMGCRFCMTAQGGFIRNLTRGEILSQVRDVLHTLDTAQPLTNIVLMGMGEPLVNYDNVVSALNTLTDNQAGFAFAGKRITLSTAGWVPKMHDLGRDTSVNLAVSLNATTNAVRDRIMPINRKYPLEVLLETCRTYPLRPHRRITFEYILLRDVNDSEADARRLSRLLAPIKAKINLIPFNVHPGAEFDRPSDADIHRFRQVLIDKHHTAIVRYSKGQDIAAACGQLRAAGTPGASGGTIKPGEDDRV
jgi:23S rRNA (adenine2503-C2)-methyltransferase